MHIFYTFYLYPQIKTIQTTFNLSLQPTFQDVCLIKIFKSLIILYTYYIKSHIIKILVFFLDMLKSYICPDFTRYGI